MPWLSLRLLRLRLLGRCLLHGLRLLGRSLLGRCLLHGLHKGHGRRLRLLHWLRWLRWLRDLLRLDLLHGLYLLRYRLRSLRRTSQGKEQGLGVRVIDFLRSLRRCRLRLLRWLRNLLRQDLL